MKRLSVSLNHYRTQCGASVEPLREGWDIDLDGPWHKISDEPLETEDRPTDRRTLREFVLEFERAASAGWLEISEVSA